MKPIKCKKLAVFRVSSPPRCSESPGVPFTNESHFHLRWDASRAALLLIVAARDLASNSDGIGLVFALAPLKGENDTSPLVVSSVTLEANCKTQE